jgi:hypothetical protein
MQQIQYFINGQFQASQSGRSFEKRSPLTGGLLAQRADQGVVRNAESRPAPVCRNDPFLDISLLTGPAPRPVRW